MVTRRGQQEQDYRLHDIVQVYNNATSLYIINLTLIAPLKKHPHSLCFSNKCRSLCVAKSTLGVAYTVYRGLQSTQEVDN